MESSKKDHWEKVYNTKKPDEVSWTQEKPETSLHFIRSFNLPETAAIIDIGGGDSKLADYLLEEGYKDISVLDISGQAIERAKKRLGTKADMITWIVADITEFVPARKYDAWHDRATFHFLTSPEQLNQYLDTAGKAVTGYMAIGTFSDRGPDKCSGLEIKKYSQDELKRQFAKGFDKIECITEDHITPFHTIQNFTFCSFKRKLF